MKMPGWQYIPFGSRRTQRDTRRQPRSPWPLVNWSTPMSIPKTGRRSFLTSAIAGASGLLFAQQPYVPKQSDRPEPLTGDEPGFKSIFDGKTLSGWEGDPKYWSVSE